MPICGHARLRTECQTVQAPCQAGLKTSADYVCLERNIVVGDWFHRRLIAAAVRHRRRATVHRGATSAATATAQQCDSVGLDLRRVPLVAVLVVPLTRLQPSFYVDLFALR